MYVIAPARLCTNVSALPARVGTLAEEHHGDAEHTGVLGLVRPGLRDPSNPPAQ